jgi:hypothetical protein
VKNASLQTFAQTTRLLPWLAVLLCGVLFIVANDWRTSSYRGFTALSWTQLDGYSPESVPAESLAGFLAVGSTEVSPTTRLRHLETAEISTKHSGIQLQYASGPNLDSCELRLAFLDSQNSVVSQVLLPTTAEARWKSASLELPPVASVRLRVEQDISPGCWSALRSRVDIVDFSPLHPLQDFFRSVLLGSIPLCLALAAAVLWLTLRLTGSQGASEFLLLLALSFVSQLRLSGFFYWDEWHVLQRYAETGLGSVLLTHNEHFLPAFFSVYALQADAFNAHYLPMVIVSCSIHAINAWLIFRILQVFGAQRLAATVLAALFAISSLHGESLQWAFEQSLLISHLLMFTSLLLLLRYIGSGSKYALALALLSAFTSPFFFGNGFIVLPYWLCLLGLYLFRLPTHLRKSILLRGVVSSGLLGICLATVALLYLSFRTGHGHTMQDAKLFDNISEVFAYIFVGSQVGTVVRGLSLIPSVELAISPVIIAWLQSVIPGFPHLAIRAELVLATLAFGVSLLLLLIGQFCNRNAYRYWFFGQALIVASLLLPALGRWHYGPSQALSLRYHYGSLLGLLLMLLPIVQYLFEGQRFNTPRARIALIGIWLAFAVQLWTAQQFTYFQEQGQQHQFFADALVDWRRTIGESANFEASGTKYAGLQPPYPATLTPGRHPNEIYLVLQWMEDR